MPLYEYQCEGCGEVFELIQKFSDEPLTVHEKCGGHVYRLLSAPALQFKGSGWYVTDYAKGNNGPAPKKDSGKKDASETKGSGDSATKSDAKSTSESKPASSDKSKSD